MQTLPETGIVWCLERHELQTRRLSFHQSGFEAKALCSVHHFYRSRDFAADGLQTDEDQEVRSTVDSPQNQTGFRQNLA